MFVFSGDIIMTGEGHKDWIADCDFHPRYVFLKLDLSMDKRLNIRKILMSDLYADVNY